MSSPAAPRPASSPSTKRDTEMSLDQTVVGQPASPPADQTMVGAGAESPGAGQNLAAGRKLGSYVLERKLGQGGMGEVWLASHSALGRKVAVKFLAPHLADKEDFVKRFYREARAMAQLKHPNAVDVYDVSAEGSLHFVAMEFIDGRSMEAWVKSLGKLEIGDAVHIVLRCAEALKQAHSQNLVHRDIKPDNIMLTSRGAVKVSDFGLAKALDDEEMSLTQSGAGLGTPYYMAPEQGRNAKHVDGRCDIYALGVTLYQLVTGQLPFGGSSAVEIIISKEKGVFPPAKKHNPSVPQRLDDLIARMIAPKVEHRYKDFGEVIRDLSNLGLESPSLSFILAPDKVSVVTAPPSHPARKPSAAAAASQDASKTKATPAGQWLVQFKDPKTGQPAVVKWSSTQIQQGLRSGALPPQAKLKKAAADAWLPLAQFSEFEGLVQGALTKQQADRKAADMRAIYAKIDKQEKNRKLVRSLKGYFSGAVGFVKLLVYLAVVGALIFAAVKYAPLAFDAAASYLNAK